MHHSKVSSKHAITSANIHIASNVGIHDVVSHIVPALMASWCTTLLALGDFCQYLIDLFIPSKGSTLANVFSICLLIGDEYLKIGTMPLSSNRCGYRCNLATSFISMSDKWTAIFPFSCLITFC
eukprot:1133615_1